MDENKNYNLFPKPSMMTSAVASSDDSLSPPSPIKAVISGGIAGGVEICITYPTEYIKTQLQLDRRSAKPRYTGIIDVIKQTIKDHGILGMYRGLSVLLAGSIPKSAVRFGAYDTFKKQLIDDKGKLSTMGKLFCGLGAGTSEAIFAVTPMETIKTKFIHDQNSKKPKYKGLFQGIKGISKDEGIGGLYRGLLATMLKQGSNQAIRFFVMEALKDWKRSRDPNKKLSHVWTIPFGIIAGAASVYANNPFDVTKTRMQSLEAHKYKNTFDCAYQIAKHEGIKAFYKGTVPRLWRVCSDVPIQFLVVDLCKELLNKIW